jgi:PAS domain S-box-containing protein
MKSPKKAFLRAGAGLLVVLWAGVSFWAFRQIRQSAAVRQHTDIVLNKASELLSELIDAETGQRGYLLTGDDNFLEPYLLVRDDIINHLETLHQLTLIKASQQHLDSMAPSVKAKMKDMSEVIELRRNQGIAAAQAAVGSAQGKRLMDSIRAAMSRFTQIEKDALTQHEAKFQSNLRNLFIFFASAGLLTLLFAFSFVYLFNRESKHRQLRITDKAAEEAGEFAKSIIDTLREPLIALDQDLRVVSVSRSFYEFFKVKPEETVGQHIYALGNKQWDIPKLRELLETILPQKATFDGFEVEHDFSAIGKRIMLLNARQVQRGLGNERIILLAIEDITERRVIEKRLEKARTELLISKIIGDEAREYAESIIDTVREPLIVLDRDLRVITASRSFYDVFKVKPEETVGLLIYDLGNKQWDIPKLRELLETILPRKTSFGDYEVEHDFATIGKRIMLLNARQVQRASGSERIILLAIEDITEKRELDRAVVMARDVAEAANKELEAFSYSVSHDLRTPLRSIDGFSQALLEDYQGTLDDTAKSYLDRVRKATQHMGRLIDDMLKLARVTRSEICRESVDMSAIVRELSDKMKRDNPGRTVDVIIQEGIFVNGDPTLLKIALENLINNAWKFTSKEERPQFEFGRTIKGGKTACFIRDNGVGFDMAFVNKLFNAFQRLHTSLEFPGVGIGLATVQRIINRHGGQVWAEAEVGRGATFYFTLPG